MRFNVLYITVFFIPWFNEKFFQPYFDCLDNTYTGFARSTAVIWSGSSVVGQMTIARWLKTVRAISHIFLKSMSCLTEGLADYDHELIFIVETSSSMSRWFQPSKQSPSTRNMSMKNPAHTVCTWISSTRKVSATSFSRHRRVLELTPKIGLYFLAPQLLRRSCHLDP